jgi:multiple sugar transport system ATP-binding protein
LVQTVAGITLDSVSKVYGDGTRAVDRLDLNVGDGEFIVLVGPSGCGKTSALRMVAGLEEITEGTVRVGDTVVNDLPPKDRDIAMVFQNYALYPHMSAYDNIGFGLKMRGFKRSEIDRRVNDAAKVLGLDEVLRRKPRTLSGGQRQRVAMGRAIVREPQAFLMDEPLSNLDAKLRVEMRAEITRIQRDLGVTTMYVTHDQTEAMTLGDKVAVMSKGVLQQLATPQELYDRPVNLFVAEFIGSPAMNIAEAELVRSNGVLAARFGEDHELVVPEAVLEARPGLRAYEGRKVVLGIRPEDIDDAQFADGPVDGRTVTATLDIREDMGSEVYAHFAVSAAPPKVSAVEEALGREAVEAELEAARRGRRRFIARLDRMTRAREGQPTQLAVDTRRLHFFDENTVRGIYA